MRTLYPVRHASNDTLDKRYSVKPEFTGDPSGKPQYVARFCGDWLEIFPLITSAVMFCMDHAEARNAVLEGRS